MKKIIQKVIDAFGYRLVPKGTLPMDKRQFRNVLYIADMYEKIRNIPGAIVECGVGKGRTFLYLSCLASEDKRAVWGFDSFEGFPEPSKEDASKRNPKRGEWAYETPESIKNILRVAGVAIEPHLVKGFVEETLGRYDGSPIALLHIDLDLYNGYKITLEKLVPCVAQRGIIMFDEYGVEKWPGATRAVDEFMKDKPWKLERHPSGKYFFIKN